MASSDKSLSDSSLMLVFSYSPAGLGHLRVTEALYDGLPGKVTPMLLGSQDKTITYIQRLVSLHPLMRSLFEWGQSQGAQEYFFTYFYRLSLRKGAKLLYKQVVTLLEQRLKRPKTLLIIATHFGLAHQIAAIKEQLQQEQKIKVVLVVVVTDDSPQFIWYVDRADLIFVPSIYTKKKLQAYAGKTKQSRTKIVVNPYPVSPVLNQELTVNKYQERIAQLDNKQQNRVHLMFPVSGAAIGMDFFVKLVDQLYAKSSRYFFHIVAKTSLYTLPYLNELMSRPYVKLHLANSDRETVDLYEQVYRQNNFALEITKPSEQAFKALIPNHKVGGSILLFAEPVGRQEIDNLNFMVKHGLIPNLTQQRYLWSLAERKSELNILKNKPDLWDKSQYWRGVVLPHHSHNCAQFIWWGHNSGLFKRMMKNTQQPIQDQEFVQEVSPDGVTLFWEKVIEHLVE